jgi:hypothetical protein
MAATPPGAVPLVVAPLVPLSTPPTWEELLGAPEKVFSAPAVPYAVVSAALFASGDPPDILLTKLEHTALESPVVLALVSDEDPGLVTAQKPPPVCRQPDPSDAPGRPDVWLLGTRRP